MITGQTPKRETDFVPFYQRLVIDGHREALITYLITEFGFTLNVASAMIDQLPELLAADFISATPKEEHHLAARAVDGFFAYLLIGRNGSGFVPSRHIDWVWENCMLRSHTWAALCAVVVGHFLHHFPWDLKGFEPVNRDEMRRLGLEATRAAVAQIGPVDGLVWTATALNGCNLCISDGKGSPAGVSAQVDEEDRPSGENGPKEDHNLCYVSAGDRQVADVLTIRVGADQRMLQLTGS
jgi:hypothetical protein